MIGTFRRLHDELEKFVGLLFGGGREEELGHHPLLCLRRLHRRRSHFRLHGGGDRRWNLAPLASFAQVFGNLLREHRRITTLGFRTADPIAEERREHWPVIFTRTIRQQRDGERLHVGGSRSELPQVIGDSGFLL